MGFIVEINRKKHFLMVLASREDLGFCFLPRIHGKHGFLPSWKEFNKKRLHLDQSMAEWRDLSP
jgi:hypothetical protein